MENNYENKGVAFKNKWKKTDRHPDYKGKGNFKGIEFEFAAWKKNGEEDQINFTFSEPYVKEEPTIKEYSENKSEKQVYEDKIINQSDGLPF